MSGLRSTIVLPVRHSARRALDRLDNEEVRKARRLLRMLRNAPPDVLYVGDSTASWTSPDDEDGRTLYTMLADNLGSEVSVYGVHGGSYHAELIDAYLGILELVDARPVVVVPLWIRGRLLPWIEHPLYGRRHAIEYLRGVQRDQSTWRIRGGFPLPRSSDFEAFYRRPYPTVAGDLTIGEYVTNLKNPKRCADQPLDRARLLYAYHHGAPVEADMRGREAVFRMGQTIKRLECPVVAYQTPISADTGEGFFGGAFRDLLTSNFAVLDAAFTKGLDRSADIIQSGTVLHPDMFIDPLLADEHLNEAGRKLVASLIADRVREELARK